MKAKGILLASVAGTVAAPMAATAADMPVKAAPKATAAPVVAAVPSWAGLYVGVHAGAAWHKAKADNNGYYSPDTLSDTKAGFIGGGLIGYNFQSGAIVAGLEADISGLSAKATDSSSQSCGPICGTSARFKMESDIDWMATLRGRLGVTTGNLLVFLTGGVAWADINNKFTYQDICCYGGSLTWSDSSVKTGPVFGGGFDYMFSPNWIARAEALWADFGTTKVKDFRGDHPTGASKTTTFKNKVVVVRGALAYKF